MSYKINVTLATLFYASIITTAHAAEDATSTLVNIDLAPGLLSEINSALPESTVVNQEFLNTDYNPNISLQSDAHVGITFIDEGAGYKNSLGYFTFSENTFDSLTFGNIDTDGSGHIGISELQNVAGVSAGMVFNNASKSGAGGTLNAGDTVTLAGASIINVDGNNYDMDGGDLFADETQVGFFLLQNAWKYNQVQGWDSTSPDPLAFYTIDFLNPENSSSATIDNADVNSRHVAMMTPSSSQNEVILGFEDLVRPWGDNDFNDAVFTVRTDPVSALFAEVPTTTEVIQLQAAPSKLIGNGLPAFIIFLSTLIFIYKQKNKQTALNQLA